jgi:4a-hydroxytetrahydrobiopterin dehydratase
MSTPLSDAELKTFLSANPGWNVENGALVRTFEASSFLSGIAFVKKVAHAAEAADHHPDIDIRWRKVTLRLVTHDAGNTITALDAQLAAGANRLFNGH